MHTGKERAEAYLLHHEQEDKPTVRLEGLAGNADLSYSITDE
jgi:hypothetical protein